MYFCKEPGSENNNTRFAEMKNLPGNLCAIKTLQESTYFRGKY